MAANQYRSVPVMSSRSVRAGGAPAGAGATTGGGGGGGGAPGSGRYGPRDQQHHLRPSLWAGPPPAVELETEGEESGLSQFGDASEDDDSRARRRESVVRFADQGAWCQECGEMVLDIENHRQPGHSPGAGIFGSAGGAGAGAGAGGSDGGSAASGTDYHTLRDADLVAHFASMPAGKMLLPAVLSQPKVQKLDTFETAPFNSVFDEVRRQTGEQAALLGEDGASSVDSSGTQTPTGIRGFVATIRRLSSLLLVILVYFVASTASVALVKLLNYSPEKPFAPPLFFALLQKSGFVVNAIVLLFFACFRASSFTWPSARDMGAYALVGFFSAGADVCDMIGLVRVQGSTYALLRTADLCFNTFLSKVALKKKFTWFHYGAVATVIAGVTLTAVSNLGQADAIGVGFILAGCFLEASNTVLSEKVLKKSTSQRSDKLRYLFEYTFWVSGVASALLVIPLMASQRYETWDDQFSRVEALGWLDWSSFPLGYTFLAVCAGISMARLAVRLTKYWIVEKRGAFTFSILKPLRRVVTVLVLILMWPQHEKMTIFKGLGMIATVGGFALYVYGSRRVAFRQREILLSDLTVATAGKAVNG